MFHLKRTICALVVFAVLASASAAQARDYYVATTGSDSNPGTLAQPFRTIVKGVSVLKPGETTFVRGGTYAESIITYQMNFPSGTSWTNAITLAVYPAERVTIQGNIAFGVEANQYIIVNGLIIDAINTGIGDAVSINQGSNHIRFKDCEIKNAYANGVWIGWGNNNGISSNFNEFINCEIHHNGRVGGEGFPDQVPGYGRGHGLYITTSNNVFRGNRVHDSGEYGFHVYNAKYPSQFANNNVIDSNVIYGNGKNTSRYGHVCCGGIVLASGSNNAVYNNLVYNNLVQGIDVLSSGNGVKVYNNTFFNNAGWNIQALAGGTGKIKNNIAYPRGISIASGSGYEASDNLTSNPNFVNAAANNFRLLSTSPAIDNGASISEVTDDFARVPRPQGSAHDIGAYEFSANQADVDPPDSPINLTIR